ncbi:MAG: ribosomal protein S18-alanine N-acetyltransferase [Lachnospiraceae bacterium]|nr:ribosomal protein S18-alanine N-acetyltransferase [Lachnospiraceae bacterium]
MEHRDIKSVAQLEQQCFSRPWSERSLEREVDNPNSLFLVYEEKQEIVGYIGMYLIMDEADITNIAVSEIYRGKGYGKKLLMEAVNRIFAKGYQAMTLEVRKSNRPAICLYERAGFKIEGERKRFYESPTEDAFIMWKRK